MNKLLLIDADGLVYHSERELLIDSLSTLEEKIHNIFEKTGGTHYVMFISNGKYFRHNIDPNYKISREKYRHKVKWAKVLKQYLIAQHNAQYMDGVEADDLVSYWYNVDLIHGKIYANLEEKGITWRNSAYNQDLEEIEKIICSPDKDLLQSIPGKHFNYSYKLENKEDPNSIVKGWWVETNRDDTYYNFWKSMICGDQTDGIKGVEGKGIKHAETLFKDLEEFSEQTLYSYIQRYGQSQGIYEFQKNYRLLHLLNCDEDFMREVGKLPEFPVISEVPKVKQETIIDESIQF